MNAQLFTLPTPSAVDRAHDRLTDALLKGRPSEHLRLEYLALHARVYPHADRSGGPSGVPGARLDGADAFLALLGRAADWALDRLLPPPAPRA